MELFEILCSTAALLLAVYYYLISTFDFWKSRGVHGPRPQFFFGTMKNVILMKQSMGDYLKDKYNEYKDKSMFGIFANREPMLVINSPELIKDILIKDFSKFADRGMVIYNRVRSP